MKDLIGNLGKSGLKKIIIISVILLVLIIGFVLFKINFLIGEQLRMTVSPEYSELKAISPGNVSLDIDVKLYNKFVCDVSCHYTFQDLSSDIMLDNGSFTSKMYKDTKYSAQMNLFEYGYGTRLYLYRIECVNMESALCISNGDSLVRKSLIVVSYEPSSEQLSALFSSRENYASISRNIANASVIIKSAGDIMSTVNITFDTGKYLSLRSERESLDSGLRNVLSLWDKGDFSVVQSYISSNDLSKRSSALPRDATSYVAYIDGAIAEHNSLVSQFLGLRVSLSSYQAILSYMPQNPAVSNGSSGSGPGVYADYVPSSIRRSAVNAAAGWNDLVPQVNRGNYGDNISKTLFYRDVAMLSSSVKNIDSSLVNATKDKMSDDYPSLYIFSNILCRIYSARSESGIVNASSNSSSNSTNLNIIGNDVRIYMCSNDYAMNIENISEVQFKLANICERSSTIIGRTGNIASSSKDSSEMLLLQYKLILDYESSYGLNARTAIYKTKIAESLASEYNITGYDPSVAASVLSSYVFNYSLVTLGADDMIVSHIDDVDTLCRSIPVSNGSGSGSSGNFGSNVIPDLIPLTARTYDMPQISYNSSDIPAYPMTPPDVPDRCCIFNKCQSCTANSTTAGSGIASRHPLILLHGHSFNQNNNAYQSVEIFNGFEETLAAEHLYYTTGMLVYGSNSTRGILGKFDVPIVSKPTYYIETYNDLLGLTVSESKTSNIDTYVLRLKESIDYTLAMTGSDKVDIVAHSMGGIVVRRYMQVFGTDKLGTVILIAAPNGGISSTTYNLCKIFGSSNECDDMNSDGLFIKKLNDLSNQPNFDHTYLVVGKGCDTSGIDGDGVVVLNNSIIKMIPEKRILYVEGNCSGASLLHNNMLNPTTYPQVYAFVKSKLEG